MQLQAWPRHSGLSTNRHHTARFCLQHQDVTIIPRDLSVRFSCCYSVVPSSSTAGLQAWRSKFKQQHHCKGRLHERCSHPGLRVFALDAAMPFDFEHKASKQLKQQKALQIAIVGFGTFGQFLAKRLVTAGHWVSATSKTDYTEKARSLGVHFYSDANDLCEAHPDVVIIATSILSTRQVLKALPVQRLKRSTLIVDVLSVKTFPKQQMADILPAEMDILCTHPMFGPDSGAASWKGLNFMYEKVRISPSQKAQSRVERFLKFFEEEGCRMVEMSCEQHDVYAARTQFITHFVGRVLGSLDLQETPIDTKGYRAMLEVARNTTNDSFDLFFGLFLYNKNAVKTQTEIERAVLNVTHSLSQQMYDVMSSEFIEVDPDKLAEALPAATAVTEIESKSRQAASQNGNLSKHGNGYAAYTLDASDPSSKQRALDEVKNEV